MRRVTSSAAKNNAAWCDVICRSHGIETASDGAAWTSRTRTPALYPDAVTLIPDAPVNELLARIDVSPGCSVKDSFASLDLTPFGFDVLFEAEWIVRANPTTRSLATTPRWERVDDADGLLAWERGWRAGDDDAPRGMFLPELLGNDDVVVLAARAADRVVAGAVLNLAAGFVGLSNFFSEPAVLSSSLAGCLDAADVLFPGSVVVGYEWGEQLDAARAHGFETVGPLRVWRHDG